jgi:hypothetical protein
METPVAQPELAQKIMPQNKKSIKKKRTDPQTKIVRE